MWLDGESGKYYNNMKSLIIYFSRADENYFGGDMKYIEKGNTEIIAEYIRDIIICRHFCIIPGENHENSN